MRLIYSPDYVYLTSLILIDSQKGKKSITKEEEEKNRGMHKDLGSGNISDEIKKP